MVAGVIFDLLKCVFFNLPYQVACNVKGSTGH
jgi:hypothetical protein